MPSILFTLAKTLTSYNLGFAPPRNSGKVCGFLGGSGFATKKICDNNIGDPFFSRGVGGGNIFQDPQM